jgi:RNA polymerase sigma factor (sigma-70 family)
MSEAKVNRGALYELQDSVEQFDFDNERFEQLTREMGELSIDVAASEELTALDNESIQQSLIKLKLRKIKNQDSLLSREQEQFLFELRSNGLMAEESLGQAEEADEKLKAQAAQGQEAYKHLINFNKGLVASIAEKYKGSGLELDDLNQEGQIGLMTAIEKFDLDKGFKFSTYAATWIRQKISKAVGDRSRIIRLPADMHNEAVKIKRNERLLMSETGEEPSIEQLAGATGLKPEKVGKVQKALRQQPSSYDLPTGESGENSIIDFIEDSEASSSPELTLEEAEVIRVAEEILKNAELSEKEKQVLRYDMQFEPNPALESGKWTQDEIAERVGVSSKYVVINLKKKALRKLKSSADASFK